MLSVHWHVRSGQPCCSYKHTNANMHTATSNNWALVHACVVDQAVLNNTCINTHVSNHAHTCTHTRHQHAVDRAAGSTSNKHTQAHTGTHTCMQRTSMLLMGLSSSSSTSSDSTSRPSADVPGLVGAGPSPATPALRPPGLACASSGSWELDTPGRGSSAPQPMLRLRLGLLHVHT